MKKDSPNPIIVVRPGTDGWMNECTDRLEYWSIIKIYLSFQSFWDSTASRVTEFLVKLSKDLTQKLFDVFWIKISIWSGKLQ